MHLKNSDTEFGLISILLHWVSAVVIIALFILGVWMLGLGYYDKGYHLAPLVHKSVGMIILGLMLFRLIWRTVNLSPAPLSNNSMDKLIAPFVHHCLYWLVFLVCITGYLIVTAADSGVSIFDWFEVPAIIEGRDGQEDLAGAWHWYLSLALIVLTMLHSAAALKHHLLNKNNTLLRMFGINS